MTVQELFKECDPELVFYAYTLVSPVFGDYDDHSLEEKAHAYRRLKDHIMESCQRLSSDGIDYSCEPMTIFILDNQCDEWGKSYLKDVYFTVVKDSEAYERIGDDFANWNDEGDNGLERYGIDFVRLSELAGYTVAEQSIENMGINTCCAAILLELFIWGFTEEDRERNSEDLKKDLDESVQDIKDGRCYSWDEFIEELDREIIADCSEDEKQHRIYEKEYKNKVEEIERCYAEDVYEINHQKYIEAVISEFRNR